MKNFLLAALVLASTFAIAQQDITVVSGTNPYIILGRGLQWGGSGPGNLNNNFIFHPTDPNVGFCLFLANNNPSSAHTVTVAVFQTGDPGLNNFTGFTGRWFSVATTTAFPVNTAASTTTGINYKTTASAGITVAFSGGSTLGGSPDTVDVFAVQTNQSSCGSLPTNSVQGPYNQGATITPAQQFPVLIGGIPLPGSTSSVQGFAIGTQANGFILDGRAAGAGTLGNNFQPATNFISPQGVKVGGVQSEMLLSVCPVSTFGNISSARVLCGYAKNSILEMATDMASITGGSMPAWNISTKVTNPTGNSLVVGDILNTSSAINVAYKAATISCSVACEFQIFPVSSAGTTCTAVTPQNLNVNQGAHLAFNANHSAIGGSPACAAQPTTSGAFLYDIFLAAGTSYTVDLTGFVDVKNAGTTQGLAVFNVTGFTGVIAASVNLVEQ